MFKIQTLESHLSFCQLCTFLRLLQLLLSFPELGQVEGSDLLGLLDLLLGSLDLCLQLGRQVAHPVLVLLLLFNLEAEFLSATLGLLVTLGALSSSSLHVAQFHLQFSDPSLQFCHSGTSAADGILVCVGELGLQLGELSFEAPLSFVLAVGVVLLGAELIGKSGSVDHCLLRLLLRVLRLLQHVVDLRMHGVDSALQGPLVAGRLRVDRGHLVDGGTGFRKFSLSLALASLGGIEKRASLLHLAGEGVCPPVGEAGLLCNLLSLPLLLLIG